MSLNKTTVGEKSKALKAEAEALKGAARLEDLSVWVMEKNKTTKKGKKTYGYCMASWREGDRVRNVHIGSCIKIDTETALQMARKMKAEALGISAWAKIHSVIICADMDKSSKASALRAREYQGEDEELSVQMHKNNIQAT